MDNAELGALNNLRLDSDMSLASELGVVKGPWAVIMDVVEMAERWDKAGEAAADGLETMPPAYCAKLADDNRT